MIARTITKTLNGSMTGVESRSEDAQRLAA